MSRCSDRMWTNRWEGDKSAREPTLRVVKIALLDFHSVYLLRKTTRKTTPRKKNPDTMAD
jgi:hypothetical protein